MSSRLWSQELKDVKRSPWDGESHRQFMKEAKALLDKIFKIYKRNQLKYNKDERSLEKAIWMLQTDALDTLRDSLELIKQKRHRVVGKMFRIILDDLDLSSLFYEKCKEDRTLLDKWYNGKIIENEKYRKHLKSKFNTEISKQHAEFYTELSLWSHPTYIKLLNSYLLGDNNMLAYDGYSEIFIIQTTYSQYLWMISLLILIFLERIEECGLISLEEIKTAWKETMYNL